MTVPEAELNGSEQGTSRRWSGKTRGGFIGNWIFATLVKYCGLRWAYLLLIPVSFYFVFFSPKSARASRQFLRRVNFPHRTRIGLAVGTWRHFFSFGQTLLDRIAVLGGGTKEVHFTFDGKEHLHNAIDSGKGVVVVGAHFGNWEVAAHLLAATDTPVNIVSLRTEIAQIQAYFDRVLKGRSFALIEADQAEQTSLEILGALGRGEMVVMQGDRASGSGDVSVPFMGGHARFPVGPYLVAALRGAPLVHTFAVRQRRYHYTFVAHPPEFLQFVSRNTRKEQLHTWVAAFAKRLEEYARRYPLQWYNFYDFWEDDGTTREARALS